MGVVKRQGIKESIVAYIGVIIGAISNLYVQPKFLSEDEIGLVKTLIAAALISTPFIQLGMHSVAVRFFPEYENKDKNHNGFLFFLLLVPFIGLLSVSIVFLLFYDVILEHYQLKASLITQFLYFIIPIAFFMGYFNVLQAYARSFLRIVVPSIFQNIISKGAIIVYVLLYYFDWISLYGLVIGLLFTYIFIVGGMLVYISLLGQLYWKPQWSFFKKDNLQKISHYTAYVIPAGLASMFVLNIDIIMVSSMLTDADAGIYGIAFFIGLVIEMPRRSLTSITSPLIAKAWRDNKISEIAGLYKKTSLNQLIAGSLVFLLVWLNIDDLFQLMPNGEVFAKGKYVVFFIGLSKLIDMSMGNNGEILIYTQHYKFNLYVILFLAFLVCLSNYLLIPVYHIVGAALASLISLSLYNLIKFIYLRCVLKMQPFSLNTLYTLLIAITSLIIVAFIPLTNFAFVNIIVRSLLIAGIFIFLILFSKVSPDINSIFNYMVNRFFNK